MMEYLPLGIVCILVLLLNLPFGYWREGVKKFSLQWALSIHIPVPLVIGLRFAFGLGFQFYTYPFMIGAFFSGQWLGAWWRRRKSEV